ncbi:URFB1 protein, partial [Scytalopus superciliaris]|nr:URFB1 protein [Scytalopus superciliaris]
PELSLRLEGGPGAAPSPRAQHTDLLRVLLRGCDTELCMSSLTSLGPFLEDEIIPEVIPMEIEVVDAKITLKDDSPPVYPTSPGPLPITLAVDHIVVRRRDDGVFYLTEEEKPVSVPEEQNAPAESVLAAPAAGARGLQLKQVPELERELQTMKLALAKANMDKAHLLQEIRKYNPLFQL